jgi:hypothetical protein
MLHRVHFTWARFKLTTSVVIGTDCIYIYSWFSLSRIGLTRISGWVKFLSKSQTSLCINIYNLTPVESQHYVIKFVSDLWQICGFLQTLLFPPPIKLTAMISVCETKFCGIIDQSLFYIDLVYGVLRHFQQYFSYIAVC